MTSWLLQDLNENCMRDRAKSYTLQPLSIRRWLLPASQLLHDHCFAAKVCSLYKPGGTSITFKGESSVEKDIHFQYDTYLHGLTSLRLALHTMWGSSNEKI